MKELQTLTEAAGVCSFALCELLHDCGLDNASRTFAILTPQRRRDSKAYARPCLDKVPPAQPGHTRDPHALPPKRALRLQCRTAGALRV